MPDAARGRRLGPETVRGFTLLEVLGAVAILGIWYFVLAALATDGLLHEGQNLRRLRAGIIADQVLAELETTHLDGSAPELMDETERREGEEADIYEIRKQVKAFTLDFGSPESNAGQATTIDPSAPVPALPSLLGQNMPGFARHLYQMNVIVSWSEGFMDREKVHRTSFIFDMAKAAESYQSEDIQAADAAQEAEQEAKREMEEESAGEGEE